MIFPIVEVEWVDSHLDNDWKPLEDVKRAAADKHAMLMRTAGFLIADESDYVVIANSLSPAVPGEETLVNGAMQIPRDCIRGGIRRLDGPHAGSC